MTSAPSGAPRARRDQFAAELCGTGTPTGLSGRDLARVLGVCQFTISRAEHGQAVLSRLRLLQLYFV